MFEEDSLESHIDCIDEAQQMHLWSAVRMRPHSELCDFLKSLLEKDMQHTHTALCDKTDILEKFFHFAYEWTKFGNPFYQERIIDALDAAYAKDATYYQSMVDF